MGRSVRGTALVAHDGFSARYDLDRIAGIFSRPTHKLAGSVNPILAQGAALGDVTLLAGFDEDITAAIPNGAELQVDPKRGVITVLD
jgi:predicted aconitase with swiveling domain